MFTGIIESQAVLKKKQNVRSQARLTFERLRKNSPLRLGESVSLEGVCLTVSDFRRNRFSADVIPETLKATTLGALEVGERVNFERALRAGERVGGHFVTGHVDGVGFLEKIERKGESVRLQIKAPREILRYLVPKGSVAIDGISFTLQNVKKSFFTVGVTPHTFRVTTLRGKRVGQRVNLEVDLFAKLVRHFLSDRRRGTLKAGLNVGKEIL